MDFAAEGDSVVYIGHSECTGTGTKAATDILELPIAVIGNGKPVGPGDIFNITNNPKNSTPANIVLSSFDLCPGGQVMSVVGTPSVDASGKPLSANNLTATNDRELYVMGRDGCLKKQMTKDVKWEVISSKCVAPKVLTPPGG
jgi:hypothetical protein